MLGTHPGLLVSDLESVYSNLNVDPLFVFSTRLDGHLQLLQGVLAHPVPSGLLHLQNSNQLPFEELSLAQELLLVAASPWDYRVDEIDKTRGEGRGSDVLHLKGWFFLLPSVEEKLCIFDTRAMDVV